jgi:hypothetical protein
MADNKWGYLDRNMIIGLIITSIILLFISPIIFCIYILLLFIIVIFIYKLRYDKLNLIKSIIANTTIIAITVFVLIIMGEIWLNLFPYSLIKGGGNDILGRFSDYTSRGYLNENNFIKNKGVFRILGLGDSFAVYLADKGKNYHNFLQQDFNDSNRGFIEIVNAGMEGIGPGYYWHILKSYGNYFMPDMVFLSFFLGNDFEEAELYIQIGELIREPKSVTKRIIKYHQFRYTRLFKFIRQQFILYREDMRQKQEKLVLTPEQIGAFSHDSFLEVELARIWTFDKSNHEKLIKKWGECAEVISDIKKWCDQRKIKLVIIIFPDQFQVEEDLREEMMNKYKYIKEDSLDLSYPDNLIINYCKMRDINYIDLLRPFRTQPTEESIPRTYSFTVAGNRLWISSALIWKRILLPCGRLNGSKLSTICSKPLIRGEWPGPSWSIPGHQAGISHRGERARLAGGAS